MYNGADLNWAGWYFGCEARGNISGDQLVRVEAEEEYSKCILPMLMNLVTLGVILD